MVREEDMIPSDLFAKVKALPGYMGSDQQMRFMYLLGLKTKVAAEIGTLMGRSAVLVGSAMKSGGGKYYCVDTFEATNAELEEKNCREVWDANVNAAGLVETCLPVVGYSFNVVDKLPMLEWVYIDGDHEYDSVVLDALVYSMRVVSHGLLLFHDTPWVAVKAACDWLITEGYMHHVLTLDDFQVFQKTNKPVEKEVVRPFWENVVQRLGV